MAVTITKTHHLVLNGWAIARADRIDVAAIKCRFPEMVADDPMGLHIGACDSTRNRRPVIGLAKATETGIIIVAVLPFQHRPIDGAAIKSGRRARLQPAHRQAHCPQRLAQIAGLRSDPATRLAGRSDVHHAAKEGTGGEHDSRRAQPALGSVNTDDAILFDDQALNGGGNDGERRQLGEYLGHGGAIQGAINLRARAVHGRALRPIQ